MIDKPAWLCSCSELLFLICETLYAITTSRLDGLPVVCTVVPVQNGTTDSMQSYITFLVCSELFHSFTVHSDLYFELYDEGNRWNKASEHK